MNAFRRVFLGILTLVFVSSLGHAAEKASRAGTKQDLVGTWEMVAVKPALDKTDPVFYPHQKFVFKSDSSMKYMASEKPFTKEWLAKFEKQPSEIDYTVSEKGLLTMTWQNRPHNEQAICAFVLSDIPANLVAKIPAEERKGLPKKGNMTLSYLNNQGKIIYQKVLQKVA